MFHVTGCEPVNPPGAPPLTREALWSALVRKARDPVPFVPAISACRVLAEGPGWLEREAVIRGEPVRERVTFFPPERVRFERLSGGARGTIENRIEEDRDGALALRFSFDLEVAGLEPGSPAERAFADAMASSYLEAVAATLGRARALQGQG